MWNLKVPLKIKHFIWRVLSKCLPTKECLISKRVIVNILCPVCNNDPKDVLHTLVLCPLAKLCLNHSRYMISGGSYDNFSDWLTAAFRMYKKSEVEVVVMICWSLWKNKNDIVWNQRGIEYTEICSAQVRSFDISLRFMTQEDGNEYWERPN